MLSQDGKKQVILLPIMAVLSTTFFVLRLVRKRKTIGLDDWLLCLAMVFLYADVAMGILMAIKGGEGIPMDSLTPQQFRLMMILAWAPELIYTVSICAVKFSILVSYYLIFGRLRWFRIATYTLAVLEALWFVGVFVAVIFQCTPISKYWEPSKPGHCVNIIAFLWGNSISNTILDYMVLFLPVLPVLNLQMGTGRKVLVLSSFLLGSLASIASTLRAVTTAKVDFSKLSETIFEGGIWTYLEPHAGVIAACLPFLAKTFAHIFLKWLELLKSIDSRKAASLLGFRSKPDTTESDATAVNSGTQRAAYEMYELGSDNGKVCPAFKHSHESIHQLV